jgi:hypothetical protein
MQPLFATVNDCQRHADLLRHGRCGVIEVADEQLVRIRLRPFSHRVSQVEALTWGRLVHRWRSGNRCWLYYRQPRRLPQFLVLDYVVSTRGTTLATFRGALGVLDELARLKRSDALVCDVATARISDRLLGRWGWEPHAPRRRHRHFIKRFYGRYPDCDTLAAEMLSRGDATPTPSRLALCR